TRYKVYTQRQMEQIEALQRLTPEQRFEMEVVAQILPFRVNEYVINELIDWDNIPADPIFQLTFPQRGMVDPRDFDLMADLLKSGADRKAITALAAEIHTRLNTHPAGQQELHVQIFVSVAIEVSQHQLQDTILVMTSVF